MRISRGNWDGNVTRLDSLRIVTADESGAVIRNIKLLRRKKNNSPRIH
jgi:hypothetical protein